MTKGINIGPQPRLTGLCRTPPPHYRTAATQQGLRDHQRGRGTDGNIGTYMFPLNWTSFIKQLQAGLCQPAGKGRAERR